MLMHVMRDVSPARFDWRESSRIHRAERARRRWPTHFEQLAPALGRGDPLADALIASVDGGSVDGGKGTGYAPSWIDQAVGIAPLTDPTPELAAFRASLETPGFAVPARLERASEAFFSTGMAGGLSLGVRSLVRGYAAPAGNKPLVLSGQLQSRAARRIGETAAFVHAVYRPGGLLGGEAVALCGKVRLMHARVRHLCLADPRWDLRAWGLPINQHDMLATILLFSSVWMDGVVTLGLELDHGAREDLVHLWRLVGHYLGVEPSLLPTRYAQAVADQTFIHQTQGPPDEDSLALVRAYLSAGPNPDSPSLLATARRRFGSWLIAELNPDIAEGLAPALGRPRRRISVRALARTVSPAHALRQWVLPHAGAKHGRAYWAKVLAHSPGAAAPRFDLPPALRRA